MDVVIRTIPLSEALERMEEIQILMDQVTADKWTLSRGQFERAYQKSPLKLFGAFEGEKLVGLATLHQIHELTRSPSFLKQVVVDLRYRRRGIGQKLVRTAQEAAKADGSYRIELTCLRSEPISCAFYEYLGFKSRDGENGSRVYRLTL